MAKQGTIGSILIVSFMLAIPPVQGQDDCTEAGKNISCTDFGTISVDNQYDMRGDPITMSITTELDTIYPDTRYMLFAVRHVPMVGDSPIQLSFVRFYNDFGDVLVDKIEQPSANELNVWVHVLDVPVRSPVTLEIEVDSADRGAFQIESLVMPFDRGYDTITDAEGEDRLLYTFTFLGVNGASNGGDASTPTAFLLPVLALAGVAIWRRRR